jgi:hypothetical protein
LVAVGDPAFHTAAHGQPGKLAIEGDDLIHRSLAPRRKFREPFTAVFVFKVCEDEVKRGS